MLVISLLMFAATYAYFTHMYTLFTKSRSHQVCQFAVFSSRLMCCRYFTISLKNLFLHKVLIDFFLWLWKIVHAYYVCVCACVEILYYLFICMSQSYIRFQILNMCYNYICIYIITEMRLHDTCFSVKLHFSLETMSLNSQFRLSYFYMAVW